VATRIAPLPVEDLFHEDDTIPEDDDAPTQPEDKFEALMRAITDNTKAITDITKRLDETDTRLGNRLNDITTKLKELDDIKRDTKNRFDKLDDTIDAAIINKSKKSGGLIRTDQGGELACFM
jgi:flagellar capping protein FliD